MKKILILFITVFVTMISTPCFAGADFILDLKPGSILFSPDIDGFRVSRTSGSDTVSGSGSWMPTLKFCLVLILMVSGSVVLQVRLIIQIQLAEADHGCPL